MRNEFLVIDPDKNTVRIPANTAMANVIMTNGLDNVKTHESMYSLNKEIKAYFEDLENESECDNCSE